MSIKLLSVFLCLFGPIPAPTQAWTRYPLYENKIYDYTRRYNKVGHDFREHFPGDLGNAEDFRTHVYEVCRYTFAGAWNRITPQQMRFFELRRSMKDRWYYCGLPFDVKPLYREYGEAAVIFYGPGRRHPEETSSVSMVSAYFSQKQAQPFSTLMTPRILGNFPGGRIEEYWQDSRVAHNHEVPLIANEVVRKLAYIHGLNPPSPRSIAHFWHQIATNLAFIRSAQIGGADNRHFPPQRMILSELLKINLEAEALWLRHYLDALRAPIVYSHGSVRVDNIYLRKFGKAENKVTFLDLGWGRYMYRSYDLADFVLGAAIKYDNRLPYPHFSVDPRFVPSPQRLQELVLLYLQNMTPLEREWPSAVNSVPALLEEIDRNSLLSHFLNGVQALFASYYDFGKMFGFPEYAKTRLDMYFRLKQAIIDRKRLRIPLFATLDNSGQLIDRGYPGAHLLNLNDILHVDPLLSPKTTVTGYLYPQKYVANNFDVELCQKLLNQYSGRPVNSLPSYYSPSVPISSPVYYSDRLLNPYNRLPVSNHLQPLAAHQSMIGRGIYPGRINSLNGLNRIVQPIGRIQAIHPAWVYPFRPVPTPGLLNALMIPIHSHPVLPNSYYSRSLNINNVQNQNIQSNLLSQNQLGYNRNGLPNQRLMNSNGFEIRNGQIGGILSPNDINHRTTLLSQHLNSLQLGLNQQNIIRNGHYLPLWPWKGPYFGHIGSHHNNGQVTTSLSQQQINNVTNQRTYSQLHHQNIRPVVHANHNFGMHAVPIPIGHPLNAAIGRPLPAVNQHIYANNLINSQTNSQQMSGRSGLQSSNLILGNQFYPGYANANAHHRNQLLMSSQQLIRNRIMSDIIARRALYNQQQQRIHSNLANQHLGLQFGPTSHTLRDSSQILSSVQTQQNLRNQKISPQTASQWPHRTPLYPLPPQQPFHPNPYLLRHPNFYAHIANNNRYGLQYSLNSQRDPFHRSLNADRQSIAQHSFGQIGQPVNRYLLGAQRLDQQHPKRLRNNQAINSMQQTFVHNSLGAHRLPLVVPFNANWNLLHPYVGHNTITNFVSLVSQNNPLIQQKLQNTIQNSQITNSNTNRHLLTNGNIAPPIIHRPVYGLPPSSLAFKSYLAKIRSEQEHQINMRNSMTQNVMNGHHIFAAQPWSHYFSTHPAALSSSQSNSHLQQSQSINSNLINTIQNKRIIALNGWQRPVITSYHPLVPSVYNHQIASNHYLSRQHLLNAQNRHQMLHQSNQVIPIRGYVGHPIPVGLPIRAHTIANIHSRNLGLAQRQAQSGQNIVSSQSQAQSAQASPSPVVYRFPVIANPLVHHNPISTAGQQNQVINNQRIDSNNVIIHAMNYQKVQNPIIPPNIGRLVQIANGDNERRVQSDLDIDQIYLDPDFDATYKGVPVRKEVKLADKPALEVDKL